MTHTLSMDFKCEGVKFKLLSSSHFGQITFLKQWNMMRKYLFSVKSPLGLMLFDLARW